MPPKHRYAVSLHTTSIGVYEVRANSREDALRLSHDIIRAGKQLTFREQVETKEAMEITLPDELRG